jgi:hypothetical protein
MKQLIKELNEAFNKNVEIEFVTDTTDITNDSESGEIEEISTTAATPGYQTPYAFSKRVKKQTYPGVAEVLDKKYEELIESYRNFATGDSQMTPDKRVKMTIKDIAKKLQEIEQLVNYSTKLKTESGLSRQTYGPSIEKSLTKISERLLKISERVRVLGE